ncbi:MAG: glutaredoxin family protein [Anaerolineae bacterium]
MDIQSESNERLIVYGHDYCVQARLLADALARHQIEHEWRDVMRGEPHFEEELKRLANGYLSVPTVLFPDGTVMVEPWPGQVLAKLGLRRAGWLKRILQKWRGD